MSEVGSLTIPPGVLEHENRQEMFRFWVAGNTGHVALKYGFLGEQKGEAYMLGQMLADVAKHYTNASVKGVPKGLTAEELLSTIKKGMIEGLTFDGHTEVEVERPDES